MARRKQTAAEYIEANALLVPFILGDLIEHAGKAAQAWTLAVNAARAGNLDRALTHVVDVETVMSTTIKVSRSELLAISRRAGNLLDAELPDTDEEPDGSS